MSFRTRRDSILLGRPLRARVQLRLLPRPSPRLVMVGALVLALLAGGWLWLRDSSLVAVRKVTVSGLSGPDAPRIRAALVSAARNMTTLDVQMGQLDTAIAPYPTVKTLQVSTQFPHGMRIRVIEQAPVGAVTFDGRAVAVASDGTLLHAVPVTASLATIPLPVPPGGAQVSDPGALAAVEVLAAAPAPLRARVSQVRDTPNRGLVAELRSGPAIIFGDSGSLRAKWLAVTAVLSDSGSSGASYIDVTDPRRPAAGAGSLGTSTSSSPGASPTGSTTSSTTTTTAVSTSSGVTTAQPLPQTTPPGG